jgi:hypothetical protein
LPSRWRGYRCEGYSSGGWARRGHLDESSQTPVAVPFAEAYEDVEHRFPVVGRSGCDGIDFGYRDGRSGLRADPIDGGSKLMGETVADLVRGWCPGTLSV